MSYPNQTISSYLWFLLQYPISTKKSPRCEWFHSNGSMVLVSRVSKSQTSVSALSYQISFCKAISYRLYVGQIQLFLNKNFFYGKFFWMAYLKDLQGYCKGKIKKQIFDPVLTKKKSFFVNFFFNFIEYKIIQSLKFKRCDYFAWSSWELIKLRNQTLYSLFH